jgi:hypothetical protein
MSNKSTHQEEKSTEAEIKEIQAAEQAVAATTASPSSSPSLSAETKPESNPPSTKKPINKTYLYGGIVVLVVILIGGGYYFYQQNQVKNTSFNGANTRNGGGQRNGANRASFSTVSGKIVSITDKNLIVDVSNNGGQKIVILSDTGTQISKTEDAIKDNVLKVDQTISVDGDKNGDSVTAKTITQRQLPTNNRDGNQNPGNMPNPAIMEGGNPAQGGRMMQNQGGTNLQGPAGAQNITFGKITAIDGDTITIQGVGRPGGNPNNNSTPQTPTSTTILINSDTKYKQQSNLKISDLKADQSVTIVGNTDTSGSITARNVVIN